MRITESQLRRIIREELESMDPQAKWDSIGALDRKYRNRGYGTINALDRFEDKLELMADYAQKALDAYKVPADAESIVSHPKYWDAFSKFSRDVQKNYETPVPRDPNRPFYNPPPKQGISSMGFREFFDLYTSVGGDLEAVKRDRAAMRDLRAEFETVDVSDETDSMYGRRSYATRHKGTGKTVQSYRDREGSLGT